MSYLAYEQRVLDELQELSTKLNALHEFLCTNQFSQLDPIDRILLLRQYGHMDRYAKVLQDRADRFVDRVDEEPVGQGTEARPSQEQALIDELNDIGKKIGLLRASKPAAVFSVLPMNEQDLLQYQHQYMCDYARILRERIALFTNQSTGDTQ